MRCLPNSGYLYYSCMAKLSGKEIQKLARSIVTENPGGIRYSVLVEKISQQTPETPKNMPTTLTEEDQSRLESLCMLFGVGLVLFDLNKDTPQFSIRVRAQRFSPDMFYVNEFADRLKHHDADVFEELFG